ncbi:MAG: DUF4197 domain-containing protein [Prevotellaceae bacterium]|jgi:hypothetical protein|nr:DUF4197 domain-containing protein [Prevotellaceae bacterium]
MKKYIFTFSFVFIFFSCTELLQVASTVGTGLLTGGTASNDENVAGLKNALSLGIEGAVANLGKSNGFLGDAALKILLPAEAQSIVENIKIIPGGQDLVNKAVQSLNAAASDAVKSATPIFKSAITSMSIADGAKILFGGNSAATDYLKSKTYTQLAATFAPKVSESLGKKLIGNTSTSQAWNSLTSAYNQIAGTPVGAIAGMKSVNVNLEQYVTQKALDALFVKIANEENAIRTNPQARVNTLLQKVFGQLDTK